jgi:hypothetical protein
MFIYKINIQSRNYLPLSQQCRALAWGEGTHSARLFTPGESISEAGVG